MKILLLPWYVEIKYNKRKDSEWSYGLKPEFYPHNPGGTPA